jgi:hypothetical protein
MKYLIIAIALFLTANVADYFVQADAWGWVNPLWENGYRAVKWGMWDFIPHDPWHIAQFVRNTGLVLAVVCIKESLHYRAIVPIYRLGQGLFPEILYTFAFYALTRGLGFSLLREVLN